LASKRESVAVPGYSIELSVVVPTLNAGATLAQTLASLENAVGSIPYEVVVADSSSVDTTVVIARRAGVKLVVSPRGRGRQLAIGAENASGDWILFLHADTRLSPDWPSAARRFMDDPANLERAAVFRLGIDSPDPAARRLERMVRWRCRRLGLPYGDQGLLIRNAFYRALGGFSPLPLMEDVDLVRRIGRGRLVHLDCTATTSAARYRSGFIRRSTRNLLCLALYFAGVPPRLIARLYG
jgi:rSAM/selenodomain-associated transferase 2